MGETKRTAMDAYIGASAAKLTSRLRVVRAMKLKISGIHVA